MVVCYAVMLPESGKRGNLLVRENAKYQPKAQETLPVEPPGPDDDNFSEVIECAPRSHDIAIPPPGREAVGQAAQNAPGS